MTTFQSLPEGQESAQKLASQPAPVSLADNLGRNTKYYAMFLKAAVKCFSRFQNPAVTSKQICQSQEIAQCLVSRATCSLLLQGIYALVIGSGILKCYLIPGACPHPVSSSSRELGAKASTHITGRPGLPPGIVP